jgi:pimeloyl-ACP methyl ester carboxylesterase
VSATGLVTAKASGTAIITVTTNTASRTDTCNVTVTNIVQPTGVTISPKPLTLSVGATQQLSATVSPGNAADKTVSWSCSNTAVVTVSATGLVTAKAAGTASITATTNTASRTDTCNVTVANVTAVKNVIVVIPGVMGSRLKYGTRQVWEPSVSEVLLGTFAREMKPYLICTENGGTPYVLSPVNDSQGAQGSYTNLIRDLRTAFEPTTPVLYFPYDWRLNLATSAAALGQAVSTYDNVYIVAHSMGGLVASSYIQQSVANKNKVKQLITLGTPFLGAAKTVSVFENGDIFGEFLADLAMSTHVKDMSANYSSTYQLLPTSRYPYSLVKLVTGLTTQSYTYTQAISFLSGRNWARTSSGATKTMMNNAISFHNGLLVNCVHATDGVPHLYITGTGKDTKSTAVYINLLLTGPYLSHFDNMNGDGTVTEISARNGGYSSYSVTQVGHSELPGNSIVIAKVKSVLNEYLSPFAKSSSLSMQGYSLPESTENVILQNDKRISLIVEGANEIEIIDKYGRIVHEDEEHLYVQNSTLAIEKIGSVWIVNHETNRKQYNLYSDEYTVSLADLKTGANATEALVIYSDSGNYTSFEVYRGFGNAGGVRIDIKPDKANLSVNTPKTVFAAYSTENTTSLTPSEVWSQKQLDSFNVKP